MSEYKFQSLYVYQLALDYIDQIYEIVVKLPVGERFNLSSQITRAATSIALNIAEGSTGQSDKEQIRFLSLALRSFLESVACLDLIERRRYLSSKDIDISRKISRNLFYKITKFQKVLKKMYLHLIVLSFILLFILCRSPYLGPAIPVSPHRSLFTPFLMVKSLPWLPRYPNTQEPFLSGILMSEQICYRSLI